MQYCDLLFVAVCDDFLRDLVRATALIDNLIMSWCILIFFLYKSLKSKIFLLGSYHILLCALSDFVLAFLLREKSTLLVNLL